MAGRLESLQTRKTDVWLLVLLFFWVLGLNGLGLGTLEFFRHTEADRTLIAWEMVDTGNYLVPHLLGSSIHTKPPLFYWAVASSITFWGEVSEWVARFPSYCISILLVLVQYLFLRRARFSPGASFLGALMLSSSIVFFTLSVVAEIDLTFGFFCTIALYGAFFSVVERSLVWTLAAYAAAGLAFLTKGPPIIFFLGISHVGFFFMHYRYAFEKGSRETRQSPASFLLFLAAGAAVFSGIVLAWLLPLAHEVGWGVLGEQIRVEVFNRVVHSSRGRGPLFYLGALIAGVTPWSLFLILGALLSVITDWKADKERALMNSPRGVFLAFNLLVVISALLMLSFAAGKSSRYLFPVHAFAVNLALYAAFRLRGTWVESKLFLLGIIVGPSGVLTCFLLAFLMKLDGVPQFEVAVSAAALAIPIAALGFFSWRRERIAVILSMALVFMALRFGQQKVYVLHRNATRSVKEMAQAIDRQLPPDIPLYTVEMFERWVNYYLKLQGRRSFRLTPALVRSPDLTSARVFLLLSENEEMWRIDQLRFYDRTLRILGFFKGGRTRLVLVEADGKALSYLEPRSVFPTYPSKPFGGELRLLDASHGPDSG